ncbi:MAG: PEGA domain-containing protein [Bacteroidetes bacterium]|nr:PEGA domain-containing protein [Bacteroidota bacterium]
MKTITAIVFFTIISIVLSSCASISNGTLEGSDIFFFTSSPSGAVITINNTPYGKTPCRIQLSQREHFEKIVVKKEGYKPVVANIRRDFNAAVIGNVIAGGVIGGVIDVLNGSIVSSDQMVHITLTEKIMP